MSLVLLDNVLFGLHHGFLVPLEFHLNVVRVTRGLVDLLECVIVVVLLILLLGVFLLAEQLTFAPLEFGLLDSTLEDSLQLREPLLVVLDLAGHCGPFVTGDLVFIDVVELELLK